MTEPTISELLAEARTIARRLAEIVDVLEEDIDATG